MEFKTSTLEAKANIDKKTIEGYFSIYGNIDDGDDIMEPGSFSDSVQKRGKRVKVMFDHRVVIGKPEEIYEDTKGLYVKGAISDTSVGRDTLTLIHDGVIDEGSIGFETEKSKHDNVDSKSVRRIQKAKLWEVSAVVWGMNALTEITGSKSVKSLQDALEAFSKLPDIQGFVLNQKNLQLVNNALTALEALKAGLSDVKSVTEPQSQPGDLNISTLIAEAKTIQGFSSEVRLIHDLRALSSSMNMKGNDYGRA